MNDRNFDLDAFERDLAQLVNIDSGSRCRDGVNRVADWFGERLAALGWQSAVVDRSPDKYGKSLFAWRGDPEAMDLLVLCHTDTVFPDGTAKARPFAKKDGLYTGPGVADMKAGCLMALYALEQLQAAGRLQGSIGLFLNGEHELSCPTTRSFIEEKSRHARVVIATEPARVDGSCVRQRKGILRYVLRFQGRSAHSGVAPELGSCANTEMARTILRLKELEDPTKGITVNPGIARGGDSVNAVPDAAECHVDIRVVEMEDALRIDQTVHRMVAKPVDERVRIQLEGGITRPPLEPSTRGDELIEAINKIAAGYGIELSWSFSGGGSDASFASPLGVPALCGMGPVGGNYHTDREFLQTVDLMERLCIFRDTVEAICRRSI